MVNPVTVSKFTRNNYPFVLFGRTGVHAFMEPQEPAYSDLYFFRWNPTIAQISELTPKAWGPKRWSIELLICQRLEVRTNYFKIYTELRDSPLPHFFPDAIESERLWHPTPTNGSREPNNSRAKNSAPSLAWARSRTFGSAGFRLFKAVPVNASETDRMHIINASSRILSHATLFPQWSLWYGNSRCCHDASYTRHLVPEWNDIDSEASRITRWCLLIDMEENSKNSMNLWVADIACDEKIPIILKFTWIHGDSIWEKKNTETEYLKKTSETRY